METDLNRIKKLSEEKEDENWHRRFSDEFSDFY